MYQIYGLRPTTKNGVVTLKHVYYDLPIKQYSAIAKRSDLILKKFTAKYPNEDYNLFYTMGHCQPHQRDYKTADIIPIDIDAITLHQDAVAMAAEIRMIVVAVSDVIDIDPEYITQIFTGNGLHLILQVDTYSAHDIKTYRTYYKELCDRINKRFQETAIAGNADFSGWTQSKLLRMPATANRKPMKTPMADDVVPKQCTVIHGSDAVVDWSWTKFIVPVVEPKSTAENLVEKKVHPEYVMRECQELHQQALSGGRETSEPLWYAALQVTAFFPSPEREKYSHQISKKHPGYTTQETDQKLEQAHTATNAPRTCADIQMNGGQCGNCKWKGKVRTPISLAPWDCSTAIEDIGDFNVDEFLDSGDTIGTPKTQSKKNPSPQNTVPEKDPGNTSNFSEPLIETVSTPKPKVNEKIDKTENVEKPQKIQDPAPKKELNSGISSTQHSNHPKKGAKIPTNGINWQEYIDLGFTSFKFEGKKQKMKREVKLLRKFFDNKSKFVNIDGLKRTLVFKDGYYQTYTRERVKAFAEKYYKPASDKDSELEEFAKAVSISNLVPPEFLQNTNEGFINLANGVLDVSKKTLLPHNSAFGFTYKLPYNHDPLAVCPTWDELLKNVTCNRPQLQTVLEEYLGYCIYGGPYSINKVLILYGEGANGKTTLVNAFQEMIGEKNCSAIAISNLSKNNFIAAGLEGKLANFSEEESPKCFKDTGPLKQVTGEGTIWCENKFEKGFQLRNRAKMIMTYNEMPFLNDLSKGMKRRLLIVPFDLDLTKHTEKMISGVNGKIRKELPGILNRALAAWCRVQAQGYFSVPSESDALVQDMVDNSKDVVSEWIDDCLFVTGNEKDFLSSRDAYEKFQAETDDRRTTFNSFCKKMRQFCRRSGLEFGRINCNGRKIRGMVGLQIIQEKGEILPFPIPTK